MATQTLLFVCTGNTCRSPMAEAIARGLVAKNIKNASIIIESAGIVSENSPFSRETAHAVQALGFAPPAGFSHGLDRDTLARAGSIFAMTRSHLAAIARLDPGAAGRAQLLDPAGHDVPDPIGGPQSQYDATARALRDMIAARLKEMGL